MMVITKTYVCVFMTICFLQKKKKKKKLFFYLISITKKNYDTMCLVIMILLYLLYG